ncbi:DciA family protein [Uliginosibacterium sp. 31-16]|uniref:DciA family protein n=1 Tax=Uliginosibacterium sp. 31-16 TaxID=3068315 RepID=UPI00273D823F|nr:DciA family protein [Uliginosibacterium sp. 31-16]MDP5238126.1 DciA family protein [Uliginosibacterium sp. 31-16]
MATSPINKFFIKSDVLSRLQDHANHLIRLQRKLDAALPAASRGAAQVANLQDGELILHVTSPVMATRLKLGLESLKDSLQAAGEPVRSITVKVRVSPFQGTGREEEAEVRPIGAGGREALQHLAEELKPDDPLARALKRMVERSAKE